MLSINDDIVSAGGGFDMHPHREMEIITYVRSGAITHRDNLGNEGRTEAGDVQVMSAGSGIVHSEHNEEDVDTNLYQIWIETKEEGVAPDWDAAKFPKTPGAELSLLVSGRAEDKDAGALYIHYLGSIAPRGIFDITFLFTILIAALLGGASTIVGPIMGAYFLTFLLEYLRPIIPGTERYFVYGLIALVVYVLEPKGLYSIIQKLYGRFVEKRRA